ncbi:MAG: OmpA/MotB domain protein [Deltaproteobacteria bacterium]|nr:OmpA/MotB domain protein [Deltaproteobacteria bacterium]
MRRWVVVCSAIAVILALGTAWSATDDEGANAPTADVPSDANPGDAELAPSDGAEPDGAQAAPNIAVPAEAAPARDRRVELGVFAGGQVVYPMIRPLSKSGMSFGLRGGYRIARWLAVETELGFAPTQADSHDVLMVAWRLHALLQLPPDGLRHGELRPFFSVGGGGNTSAYASTRRDGQELQVPLTMPDTDLVIDAGMGVKYTGLGMLGLRMDVRAVTTPLGKDLFEPPDFELLVGAYGRFGRPRQPSSAPVPSDPDGDHLIGEADRCPTQAEDVDEFEDTDGCPDPDNDGDQILDADDHCPLEPENVNAIDDEDGCPDADEDGDGVLGSTDACPTQPEDVDGFQDQDGCPDPDNDGDGVLDADDKCPAELEVVNGFEDADGCPDKLPPQVLAIVGRLKGVTFDRADALALRGRPPRSAPLDKLASILAAFPSVAIEISAHGQGKGDPEKVLAATSRRADAIKSYLVGRGVDEARITASGRGLEAPITDKRGTRTIERIEVSVVGLAAAVK